MILYYVQFTAFNRVSITISPCNHTIVTHNCARNKMEINGLHVEEVTVYRHLYGRSEAETYKLDKGRGEAEFLYQRCTVTPETWNPIIPRNKTYIACRKKHRKSPKIDLVNV